MQALTLYEFIIGSGIGATIVSALIWSFRSYIGNYLTKKAENLATKQDIQSITRLQEEVKAEFEQILEMQRSEAQLRLAVIERRFQAHQEAHSLWLKLLHSVHSKDNPDAVMECQQWWGENSLYLDPKPRVAFIRACNAAFDHPSFLQGPRDAAHTKLINENWQLITDAGSAIEAAVNLPSLDRSESLRPGVPEPAALPDDG